MKSISFSTAYSWLFILLSSFVSGQLFAQKDTTTPPTVTIISAYQPEIRPPAKINFSGSQLPADTTKLVRAYKVPVQSLHYVYQPVILDPMHTTAEDTFSPGVKYLAKVGVGNLSTPFASGAARFNLGEQLHLNAYGLYTSSKGKIQNQDYSLLQLKARASADLDGYEAYAGFSFNKRQYYQYGYDHTKYTFDKSQLNQQFNNMELLAGFKNTASNNWGIYFDPTVRVDIFSKKDSLTENSLLINLPAKKYFNQQWMAAAEIDINNTRYHTTGFYQGDFAIINNVLRFRPSVDYGGKYLNAHVGVNAVNSFKKWALLPDVTVEVPIPQTRFVVQAGWVGVIQKNTIKNLSMVNPYINTLPNQFNTREVELYGGVKATVGKHVFLSCKASYIQYHNFQLFVNDTSVSNDGRGFLISNEPEMNNFRLHGDISYVVQNKFTLTGKIDINAYSGLKVNKKAWHTVPVECNANVKWQLLKNLEVSGDFYFFGGGYYLERGNQSGSFNGGADFSVGADYKINNHFGAFIRLNNIFGKNYERWHNYPVYGLNGLLGVSCRF